MEATLDSYFNSKSVEDATRHFAEDYHLYFNSEESGGFDKKQVEVMLGWDYELNPEHKIYSTSREGNVITVELHEENDFSKALGFPGWKATVIYTFNDEGLIHKQVFLGDPGNQPFKKYLQPLIDWAREHRYDVLASIYDLKSESATYNKETARKWMQLVADWKASNNSLTP